MYNNGFIPTPEVINFNYFNRLSNIEQLLKKISVDIKKIEQKLDSINKDDHYTKNDFSDEDGMYMM